MMCYRLRKNLQGHPINRKGKPERENSMSEKGLTGKPFTGALPQGLDEMGKAKLLEV